MADTFVDKIAVAGETDFPFNFPYLEDEHVKVYIDDVKQSDGTFTISTTPEVRVILNTGATAGEKVRVRRKSQPNVDLVDFVNGSVLTEAELDRAYRHNRYLAEEAGELSAAALDLEGVIQSNQIADGAVGTTKLDDGAVSTIKIADDAVNASKLDETVSYTVNGLSSTGNVSITGDLNITGDYKVNGTNLQTVPPGGVIPYAGATVPSGWLLCDGGTIGDVGSGADSENADYETLFNLLKTFYPNTSTEVWSDDDTVLLPDLRGRVVAGKDNMGGTSADRLTGNPVNGDNLGATGGAEDHLLTAAQSGLRDHQHNKTTQSVISGAGYTMAQSVTSITNILNTGEDASATHNNVQPTMILNYIIKT